MPPLAHECRRPCVPPPPPPPVIFTVILTSSLATAMGDGTERARGHVYTEADFHLDLKAAYPA